METTVVCETESRVGSGSQTPHSPEPRKGWPGCVSKSGGCGPAWPRPCPRVPGEPGLAEQPTRGGREAGVHTSWEQTPTVVRKRVASPGAEFPTAAARSAAARGLHNHPPLLCSGGQRPKSSVSGATLPPSASSSGQAGSPAPWACGRIAPVAASVFTWRLLSVSSASSRDRVPGLRAHLADPGRGPEVHATCKPGQVWAGPAASSAHLAPEQAGP